MSLNWDVRNTPAYAQAVEEDRPDDDFYTQHQRNVLDTLIWATLAVDLPGIPTEEDADEMLFRLRFLERTQQYTPTVPDLSMPQHLTEEEAKAKAAEIDGAKAFRHPDSETEWYVRLDRALTREDMQEWVGMTTNVSRKSRHQFVQRHAKRLREDVERRVVDELQQFATA